MAATHQVLRTFDVAASAFLKSVESRKPTSKKSKGFTAQASNGERRNAAFRSAGAEAAETAMACSLEWPNLLNNAFQGLTAVCRPHTSPDNTKLAIEHMQNWLKDRTSDVKQRRSEHEVQLLRRGIAPLRSLKDNGLNGQHPRRSTTSSVATAALHQEEMLDKEYRCQLILDTSNMIFTKAILCILGGTQDRLGVAAPGSLQSIEVLLSRYASACASRDVVKLPQLARYVFDQPRSESDALRREQVHQQEIWARIVGHLSRGSLGLVSMYLLDSKRVSGDSRLNPRAALLHGLRFVEIWPTNDVRLSSAVEFFNRMREIIILSHPYDIATARKNAQAFTKSMEAYEAAYEAYTAAKSTKTKRTKPKKPRRTPNPSKNKSNKLTIDVVLCAIALETMASIARRLSQTFSFSKSRSERRNMKSRQERLWSEVLSHIYFDLVQCKVDKSLSGKGGRKKAAKEESRLLRATWAAATAILGCAPGNIRSLQDNHYEAESSSASNGPRQKVKVLIPLVESHLSDLSKLVHKFQKKFVGCESSATSTCQDICLRIVNNATGMKYSETLGNTTALVHNLLEIEDLATAQMRTLALDCAHQVAKALLRYHHDIGRRINSTSSSADTVSNDKIFQSKINERQRLYGLLILIFDGHISHALPSIGMSRLRGVISSQSSANASKQGAFYAAEQIGDPCHASRIANIVATVASTEMDFAMQQMILPLIRRFTSVSRKLKPKDWMCPTAEVVLRSLLLIVLPVLDDSSDGSTHLGVFPFETFRTYSKEISRFLGEVVAAGKAENPSEKSSLESGKSKNHLSSSNLLQSQTLRIMLFSLKLLTSLPPVPLLSARWDADVSEEDKFKPSVDNADGSDFVDEILSIYMCSCAESIRAAALMCIRRLLEEKIAGSIPELLFETRASSHDLSRNRSLPSAEIILNRVATVAASVDVWSLNMWTLHHSQSSSIEGFWRMHEWIGNLCCMAIETHLSEMGQQGIDNDLDEADTFWADTADVFDNICFLLFASPSVMAQEFAKSLMEKGQHLRKKYAKCITAVSSTENGVLWEQMNNINAAEDIRYYCEKRPKTEQERFNTLMHIARSLDSQVVSLAASKSLINIEEAVMASPIVCATQFALDAAESMKCYFSNENTRMRNEQMFSWWRNLTCIGYATLGSKIIIEECRLRTEGEDLQDYHGLCSDLPSKAYDSIQALTRAIDDQAQEDAKSVHKIVSKGDAKQKMENGTPQQCTSRNGMHNLGENGIGEIMEVLTLAAGNISEILVQCLTESLLSEERLSKQLFGLQKEFGGAGTPNFDATLPFSSLKSKLFQRKWLERRILQRSHTRIASYLINKERSVEIKQEQSLNSVSDRVAGFIRHMAKGLLDLRPSTHILRTASSQVFPSYQSEEALTRPNQMNPSLSIRIDFCLIVAELLRPESLSGLRTGFPCDRFRFSLRDRVSLFEACLAWQGHNGNDCELFTNASQECMVALLYGTDFAFDQDSMVWQWIDALYMGGDRFTGTKAVVALLESEWAIAHNTKGGDASMDSSVGAKGSPVLALCIDKCCIGLSAARRSGYTFALVTVLHHWSNGVKYLNAASWQEMSCRSRIFLAGSTNSGFISSPAVRSCAFELLDISSKSFVIIEDSQKQVAPGTYTQLKALLDRVSKSIELHSLKQSWTTVANATSNSISSSNRFILNCQSNAIKTVIQRIHSSKYLDDTTIAQFVARIMKHAVSYMHKQDGECSLALNTPTSSSILRSIRFVRGVIIPWISLSSKYIHSIDAKDSVVFEMAAQILETCHVLNKLAWESVEQGKQKVKSQERIAARLANFTLDLMNPELNDSNGNHVGTDKGFDTLGETEDSPSLNLVNSVCVELWRRFLNSFGGDMAESVNMVAEFLVYNCSAGLADDDFANVQRKSFAAAVTGLYSLDSESTLSILLMHSWPVHEEDNLGDQDVGAVSSLSYIQDASSYSSNLDDNCVVSHSVYRYTAVVLLSELDLHRVCNLFNPCSLAQLEKVTILGLATYVACHVLVLLSNPAGCDAGEEVSPEILGRSDHGLTSSCCSILLDIMRCFGQEKSVADAKTPYDDSMGCPTKSLQNQLICLASGRAIQFQISDIVAAVFKWMIGHTNSLLPNAVGMKAIIQAMSTSKSLSLLTDPRANLGEDIEQSTRSVLTNSQLIEVHSALLVALAGVSAFASGEHKLLEPFPSAKCLLFLLSTLKTLVFTAQRMCDENSTDSENCSGDQVDEHVVSVIETCVSVFVGLIESNTLLPDDASLLLAPRILWIAALLLRPRFVKSGSFAVRLFNAGMLLMNTYLIRFDVSKELQADLVMSVRPKWIPEVSASDKQEEVGNEYESDAKTAPSFLSVMSTSAFPGVMHLIGFGIGVLPESDALSRKLLFRLLVAHSSMDDFVFPSLPSLRRRLVLCTILSLPWLYSRVEKPNNDAQQSGNVKECIGVIQKVCQTVHAPELEDALSACLMIVGNSSSTRKNNFGQESWFTHSMRAIVAEIWEEVMNDFDDSMDGRGEFEECKQRCARQMQGHRDGARFAAHCVELIVVQLISGDITAYRVPALKLLHCLLIVDGDDKNKIKSIKDNARAVKRAACAVLDGIRNARKGLLETVVQCLLKYTFCTDASAEEDGRAIAWEIISKLSSV